MLAVFVVSGVVLGAFGLLTLQARENRRAILRRLLERTQGELPPADSLFRDALSGTNHGRSFKLSLGGLRPTQKQLRAEVELHNAPPIRLRIRKDQGLAAVEKMLGLVRDVEVSGGDSFDRKFLVEADAAPASGPLADDEVRSSVKELLGYEGLYEVAVEDGTLRVWGVSQNAGQQQLHRLLDALDVLAHAYDRKPALEAGISVSERFVWTGGADSGARCPYCHDGIGHDDADTLIACGSCSTLLHEECHQENGGCPILGCGGRGAERLGPISLKE